MKPRSLFRESDSFCSGHFFWSGNRHLLAICLLLIAGLLAVHPLGAQTFKNPKMISTATDPTTISEGDFNADGKPDLVYLDGGSPVVLHVLLGNGDGTFQHGQDIQLPSGIGGRITVADVNKDGKLDLVLGGGGPQGQVGVLLGNGDGTFQPLIVSQFPAAGSNFATIGSFIGVADFNGDGAVDLAAADTLNDAVYILLGNNSGSFTLKSTLFNGSGPTNVFTGDFNGDGHPDILVQGVYGADATVYLGNGDGTFQAGARYTGPHNIGSILLHDMDGDGHPDLVVTDQLNAIDILHGNPDGTFSNTSSGGAPSGGPGASLLAVFDFNSDGILDIATATANGISILLGKGNLSYSPPVPYSGSPTSASAVMADFNGDGYQDFAEIAPGGIALCFGAAGGTLQSADLYDLGEGLNAVVVADFNGDHIPDIAVNAAEPFPRLLIGLGGGKFSLSPSTGQSAGTITSTLLAKGDFNGDGKIDLLATGSTLGPQLFYGNGNGTFEAPVTVNTPTQNTYGHVVIADFNHDGISDIAALDYGSLDILLGQRNNTFTTNSYADIQGPIAGAAGDLNNDGKIDLVLSLDQANPLQILLGNGDGTFQFGHQLPIPNLPGLLAAADLDGDGNTDIIASFGTGTVLDIFYGNGDGTFQDPLSLQLERGYSQMAIADMNGDGRPDLVLSDGSVIVVILNLGDRSFGPEQHFLAGSIVNFALADLNGDGLTDIVVANGGTTVTVLLNQAAATIAGNLQITPEPSTYGQPFTLSLSISPQGSNPPTPSGTVAFSIDDVPLVTIPVTGLNLSYNDANAPSLPVGVHTIVAAYSGDKNFLASTFTVQHEIVPDLYPTSTTVTAAPTQALASQTIRFTATVTSPGQNVNAPNGLSGTVVFRDGSLNLGTGTVGTGGVAIFDTALLAAGTHSVTASYLGYTAERQQTGSFAPSTSPAVTVAVTASPTNTNLTALPTLVQAGSVVLLTATVTSATGAPTGAVTFFDGNLPLSAQPVDGSGSAVFSATFGNAGAHILTASYQANASFAGSTSAPLSLTVNTAAQAAQSSVGLTAVPSSQLAGQIVLTATVVAEHVVPTGQVIFLDGATQLGSASLNGQGTATYALTLLNQELHYLSAYYPGNSSARPGASPTVLERNPLNKPDFALNVSAASVVMRQGQSTTIAVTVNPINGFNRQVSLSCTSQPSEMSCRFEHASLPNGRGTSVLMINTAQTHTNYSSMPRNYQDSRGYLPGLALLSSLVLLTLTFSRRRLSLAFACLFCALSVAGCRSSQSHPTPVLTPAGAYVVTLMAVPSDPAAGAPHSAQVQITVEPSLN